MRRTERVPDGVVYAEGRKRLPDTSPGRLAALAQSELFADCLSALLLATGLSAASMTVTVLDGGLWDCFGLACLSLACLLVLRLRWWLAPLLAGLPLAGTAAWRCAEGDLAETAAAVAGFFRWAWLGAPYDELYSEGGGLPVLLFALVFALTLAAFLAVRRLFSFLPTAGLTAAAFLSIHAYGKSDLSVALCFASAGLIVLLPRVYARYVEKQSPGGAGRGSFQAVAVPGAVLALVLSLWLIPEDTMEWRSRGLGNLAADIGTLFGGPFHAAAAGSSDFSMSRIGFQPDGSRLGGPVRLGEAPVLTVTSERPILLRGGVADLYTGENWAVGGSDGDLRYGSLFWRGYRREAFDNDMPLGNREARRLYASLTAELELEAAYESNRYSTLFAGGGVQSARIGGDEPPYFNMRSELYLHARVPWSARLKVETRVWLRDTPDFDADFLRLEELCAEAEEERLERIAGRYTALPETLPGPVRELAEAITGGIESPYLKARAIEGWLRDNCAYTLEPAMPPEGADFVAHFLQTREGYCTYYASAMAVLARCAGLPSRYVTGFALERGTEEGVFRATQRTAHAWAEIYFRGIGWLEFDPLRWDADDPLNGDAPLFEEPPPSAARETPSEGQGETGVPAGPDMAAEPEPEPVPARSVLAVLLAAAALIFLLRAALCAVMRSKLRAYELRRVLRRIPGAARRLDFYYADIVRQLFLLGMEAGPGETLRTFPQRVDRRFRFEDAAFTDIANARMRQYFAGIGPADAEVEAASLYHKNLEYTLMDTMGKPAYFFRRAIRPKARPDLKDFTEI